MKRLFLAMTLASLAACSVLPKREPVKVYEPEATTLPVPTQWPAVDWSLMISRPTSSQTLDSERILVHPSGNEVQVYKGAIWSDNINDLVQTSLIRRLEDSGKIVAVSRPGAGMRSKYQLLSELRSFDSNYVAEGSPPETVIELRAKLLFTATGEVVSARSFRQSQVAAGEETGDVVAAFSQSLARITDDIAGWTLETGQGHAATKR